LLPEIFQELIGTLKEANQELAKAEDEMQKDVLEVSQLALKIRVN